MIFHYAVHFRILIHHFPCLYLLPSISICSTATISSPCSFLGNMWNENCSRCQNSQSTPILLKTANTEWHPKL